MIELIEKIRWKIGFTLIKLGSFIMNKEQRFIYGQVMHDSWAKKIKEKGFKSLSIIEGGSNEKH